VRPLQVFRLGVAETSLLCDHEKVALSSRIPVRVVLCVASCGYTRPQAKVFFNCAYALDEMIYFLGKAGNVFD
jgi:hypothetical protein